MHDVLPRSLSPSTTRFLPSLLPPSLLSIGAELSRTVKDPTRAYLVEKDGSGEKFGAHQMNDYVVKPARDMFPSPGGICGGG